MVRGVVIIDNRGYRIIASLLISAFLLAVPAGIRLWNTSRSGDGDRQRIERIRSVLQIENDRRLSEVADINNLCLRPVGINVGNFGG